jgi:hypothetical protein
MAIGFLLLMDWMLTVCADDSASAGIVTFSLPSVLVREPPAGPMVIWLAGVLSGVPTGVATPVGIPGFTPSTSVLLQEEIRKTKRESHKAKVSRCISILL